MFRHTDENLSAIFDANSAGAISSHQDLFSSSIVDGGKRHDTYRLVESDGIALPSVVILAAFDVEDFFAGVATYYQDQSPLSAMTYVLGKETFSLFDAYLNRPPRPTTQSTSRARLACLGAACGEYALSAIGLVEGRGAPSYAACKRTLAFSLCRTALLHGVSAARDLLIERWRRLRQLTGLSLSQTSIEAVVRVHSIAFDDVHSKALSSFSPEFVKGLKAIVDGDDLEGETLLELIKRSYFGLDARFEELRGAFDGRLTAFGGCIEAIQAAPRGGRMDEIAVAFICNKILPGSFAHVGVLEKLAAVFPAALVWYGFFSAMVKPLKTAQSVLGPIAKLERDLIEPFRFDERPKCDISLEELEVLSRMPLRADMIKPSNQRAILVALLPGVDVYSRFEPESDATVDRSRRNEEAEEALRRVNRLLEDALTVVRKAGPPSTTGRGSAPGSRLKRQRNDQ